MCSNCYNGCTEVVSDQCVRYTGIDVPVLGIKTGDSLSYVEQAFITFLTSTLDGTGIKLDISSEIICDLVKQYLPTCEDLTALNLFKALIEAACSLQTQLDAQKARIDVIEADYDIACLEGVSTGDGTHAILQAVITNLCATNTALAALALNVSTNYVAIADLNTLIAAYLASITPSDNYSNRMVPYAAQEYYGSLANFDLSGAGLGLFANIYLCNGNNGTPDKRGVVPVGAIAGVPGGALDSAVDPGSSAFNPNYAVGGGIVGTNSVILDTTEIPSHIHIITDPGHFHFTVDAYSNVGSNAPVTTAFPMAQSWLIGGNADYQLNTGTGTATLSPSQTKATGITQANSTGGDLPHDNKQPALACYYIISIP